MRILVTGAGGQLGSTMVDRLARAGHDVVAARRVDLDLTRHDAVQQAVAAARPDVVINCAAYNDVDRAEDEATAALDVNAFAVRSLARAAEQAQAVLVHYSTDFVFDGTGRSPYREDDRPSPQSVYAASKLLGEWFAGDAPRHYVLRVESLFGGSAARSSIDRIIGAIREGRPARVFSDRVVSPTYVDDCADATMALLERREPCGLYHCVNSGHTTWEALAREIAERLGVDALIEPVEMASIPMRATRPVYCALSNEKLRAAGVVMPTWQDAVARHLSRA